MKNKNNTSVNNNNSIKMDDISFISGLPEENYESSAALMENISFI